MRDCGSRSTLTDWVTGKNVQSDHVQRRAPSDGFRAKKTAAGRCEVARGGMPAESASSATDLSAPNGPREEKVTRRNEQRRNRVRGQTGG